MFQKKTIFTRILFPVTLILLLQALLVGLVLFFNGTVHALEQSAVENLRSNAENRMVTLTNMMLNNWSNLDKLESDINTVVDDFLRDNNLTIQDLVGNRDHETAMLNELSSHLLDTLRKSLSTGTFLCLFDGDSIDLGEGMVTSSSLYYRDLDPFSTPADYSDILFIRGNVDIARKNNIQMDSLWSEYITFSAHHPDLWAGFTTILNTTAEHPELDTGNQAYWNKPHYLENTDERDATAYITYTRPLFYKGKLIGLFGTEVQTKQLDRYYPAQDFGTSGQGGYLLLGYDRSEADAEDGTLRCQVYGVTGSYIGRMMGGTREITLKWDEDYNAYTLECDDFEDAKVVLFDINLYNRNAPHSNEQWALASIGTDNMLFVSARSVTRGVLYSTITASIAGIVLLAFVVRITTKPLFSIVSQIESGDAGNPHVLTKSETYEIKLLCDTINNMNDRRKTVENQLREERERYLMALESAADIFVEYDVEKDIFMVYHFSDDDPKTPLSTRVINAFTEQINQGEICHLSDKMWLISFLRGETHEPVEVRFLTDRIPEFDSNVSDGAYHWYSLRASLIRDEQDVLRKVIGIARNITADKLRSLALSDAKRRDPATGFFNSEYGTNLVQSRLCKAFEHKLSFALCLLRVDHFDSFEAYYGRLFTAAVLMEFCLLLPLDRTKGQIAVRLSNDVLLLYFPGCTREDVETALRDVNELAKTVYCGENPELRLRVSMGAVMSDNGSGDFQYERYVKRGEQALFHAVQTQKDLVFYTELPAKAKDEHRRFRDKPVSVSPDMSREGIVGFVFDIFERTTDTPSTIKLLLRILGRLFSLSQILVCSFNEDFGTHTVTHQWNGPEATPFHEDLGIISHEDFKNFSRLMDENGSYINDGCPEHALPGHLQRLLCLRPGEECALLCCVMHENGIGTGKLIFKSPCRPEPWSEDDLYDLREITKIFSAHLSIERSNNASRVKTEFLSRMSHEIRTPMNAIIGMTGIAKESVDDRERLVSSLGKIDFSAKHLLALINDVLDMSRIESGKMPIRHECFSLSTLTETLDMLMRPSIEAKNIRFLIQQKVRHPDVFGDEYRLRQVMVNLLGNALKFTDGDGTITLTIEETPAPEGEPQNPGSYRFAVRDTGIGVEKEDQALIFTAFEQARSGAAAARQTEGTGLGLPISASIVNSMGGSIKLNSAPGQGSEFYFILQMEKGEHVQDTAAMGDSEADYEKLFAEKRILLTEDNEINIEIARYLLEQVGFHVTVAHNGQESVDTFMASDYHYFDAIIMDIQMPVMNGMEASRAIRKCQNRPDARTIPIIAMTANAFEEDAKKAISSGMNGHLAKPIDTEKLYALLRQFLVNDSS